MCFYSGVTFSKLIPYLSTHQEDYCFLVLSSSFFAYSLIQLRHFLLVRCLVSVFFFCCLLFPFQTTSAIHNSVTLWKNHKNTWELYLSYTVYRTISRFQFEKISFQTLLLMYLLPSVTERVRCSAMSWVRGLLQQQPLHYIFLSSPLSSLHYHHDQPT